MSQFIKLLTFLGQENTIKSAGFTAGMIYTICGDQQMCVKVHYENQTTDKGGKITNLKVDTSQLSILENPLSTLLVGSINGVIYGMCSSFVGGMLPHKFRPLVPICLGMSMLSSAYKWRKNY